MEGLFFELKLKLLVFLIGKFYLKKMRSSFIKLFLLAAGVLLMGPNSFAQNRESTALCQEGFVDSYEQTDEDFTNNFPVTYWGDTSVYRWSRDGSGLLNLAVTQSENDWQGMGFSIWSSPSFIDISSNNLVGAEVTNLGMLGVEMYWSFVSNGTSWSSQFGPEVVSGGVDGSPFGGVIQAGETKVFEFDLSGARRRMWVNSVSDCDNEGGVLLGTNECMIDMGFDSTKLSSVEFLVVGQGDVIQDKWTQPAISNHPLTINYIWGGKGSSCLSSSRDEEHSLLSVYPNPCKNSVTISTGNHERTSISLIDLTGSVVLSRSITSKSFSLDVSGVSSGVYFLISENSSGKESVKLFIDKE